jgi:hypothetical protein
MPKTRHITACLLSGAALLGGCYRNGGVQRVDDQKAPFNRWTVETMDDESIRNAVIVQHTLYAYHFEDGSATLNGLGERDVKILASHLIKNPGEINVHRAGEADALYQARVDAVSKMLAKFDVPPATIKIADKMPGGEGISSERSVLVLKRTYDAKPLIDASQSISSEGGSGGQGGSQTGSGQGGSH